MPASNAIVGRIAVKVLPDTDKFREEAERKLDAIEKRLRVDVPARLDGAALRRDVVQTIRTINAENKQPGRAIRFQATISKASIASAVSEARREMQALANTKGIDFKAGNLNAGNVSLTLDPKTLKDIEDQLERWRARVSPIKIDVRTDVSAAAATASTARLAVLARDRIVNLIPVVSPGAAAAAGTALAALSGARVLHTYFDKMADSIKNLDKSVPIIGTLSLAVAGLAGYGITAVSNLATLAVSLAQIGPAALVLPGIFGGIAIGVGTMVAALKDFHTVFPDVKKAFSDMQDTISKNFWAEATTSMRAMLDTILPQLAAGLGSTGTALGGYFAALAEGVRGTLSQALGGMFADLAESINIASTGTGALVGIITTLGTVGAGYLPQLAKWFVDISTQFNNFLSAAAADGRLKGWIDTALVNLQALGSSLASIGGIFMAIGQAAQAAGGSSLVILADTLNRIQATVESPGFQQGLTDVFKAAHDAMSNIATVSGPAVENFFIALGKVLTAILPTVGTAIGTLVKSVSEALSSDLFTGALVKLFDSLGVAVQALAPAFAPLSQILAALMPIIGDLAVVIASLITQGLQILAPLVTALAPAIQPLIGILGGALLTAMQALQPVIVLFAQALVGLVQNNVIPMLLTALSALVPVVTALAPLVGQALVAGFTAIASIIPPLVAVFTQIAVIVGELAVAVLPMLIPLFPVLAEAFNTIIHAVRPVIEVLGELLKTVLPPLVKVISEAAQKFIPQIADAFAQLMPEIKRALEMFTALFNFLKPVLIPLLEFLVGLILGSVVGAIKGIATAFSGALDIIQGVFKFFKSLFTMDVKGMWEAIKLIFTGAFNLIKGAFEAWMNLGILAIAKKAISSLVGAIKGLWDNIMGFFKSGTGNALTTATNFFGSVMTKAAEFIGKIVSKIGELVTKLPGTFTTAFGNALSAVGTGIGKVVGVIAGLPGKCASAMGNIGQTLRSAGMWLIEGFINGIKSMFGKVQGTLGDLTSKLTSWKGPESLDRVILTNAGELVMQGFINGLESKYDAVRDSLKGFSKGLGRMEFASPSMADMAAPTAGVGAGLPASAAANAAEAGSGVTKVFNYYAASGNSLSSEEELFQAASRARMVGW